MPVRIGFFRTASQIEAGRQAERDYEQRRTTQSETRRLYKTARWQSRRSLQLRDQPLCERCLEQGLVVAANVANHKVPHRGDVQSFWAGELESVCDPCHNGVIQAEEHAARSSPPGGSKVPDLGG